MNAFVIMVVMMMKKKRGGRNRTRRNGGDVPSWWAFCEGWRVTTLLMLPNVFFKE